MYPTIVPFTPAQLQARLTDSAPSPLCPWCPGFISSAISHHICPSCLAKLNAECDAAEVATR